MPQMGTMADMAQKEVGLTKMEAWMAKMEVHIEVKM
jgi:hypothetical protein